MSLLPPTNNHSNVSNGLAEQDSIIDDDFEVIRPVESTYESIDPNMSLLPASLLPQGYIGDDTSIITTNGSAHHETALLNQSVYSTSTLVGAEGEARNGSVCTSGDSSSVDMYRSHMTETTERLEKHLKKLEDFSLIADQIKQSSIQSTELKSAMESLTSENSMLRQKCDEAEKELASVTEAFEELKQSSITSNGQSAELQAKMDAMAMQSGELIKKLELANTELATLRAASVEMKNRANEQVSALENQNATLCEDRDEMKKMIMQKTSMIEQLSARIIELEKANRVSEEQANCSMTLLARSPSFDEIEKMRKIIEGQNRKIDDLNNKLSEEFAARVDEHERRVYVEGQMRSLRTFESIPPDQEDKSMIVLKISELEQLVGSLKKKISDLEQAASSKNNDSDTKDAIIEVMREDSLEATRLLTERERMIEELQKKLARYGLDQF